MVKIMSRVFKGMVLPGVCPKKADVHGINFIVSKCISSASSSVPKADSTLSDRYSHLEIPPYINSLIKHFFIKQEKILFNLILWHTHCFGHYESHRSNFHGFKKLAKVFMHGSSIKYDLFVRLLPNLNVFTVGNLVIGEANPAIELTQGFTSQILEVIDYINSTSLLCIAFQIIRPSSSISSHILNNQTTFNSKECKLIESKFKNEGKFRVNDAPMLLIQKNTY